MMFLFFDAHTMALMTWHFKCSLFKHVFCSFVPVSLSLTCSIKLDWLTSNFVLGGQFVLMMWVNFEMVWWWWKHSQKEENEILMDVIMLRCILVFLLSLILLIDFEKAFVAISFISQFLVFFCARFNYSFVFIPCHFLIMKWLSHPVIPFQVFLTFFSSWRWWLCWMIDYFNYFYFFWFV